MSESNKDENINKEDNKSIFWKKNLIIKKLELTIEEKLRFLKKNFLDL